MLYGPVVYIPALPSWTLVAVAVTAMTAPGWTTPSTPQKRLSFSQVTVRTAAAESMAGRYPPSPSGSTTFAPPCHRKLEPHIAT